MISRNNMNYFLRKFATIAALMALLVLLSGCSKSPTDHNNELLKDICG